MTYTEFRQTFDTVEDFKKALGQLSEEEAKALISADSAPAFIKACMMQCWREAT